MRASVASCVLAFCAALAVQAVPVFENNGVHLRNTAFSSPMSQRGLESLFNPVAKRDAAAPALVAPFSSSWITC
jgi:hypothetical protein